jgi:hypothetical protein
MVLDRILIVFVGLQFGAVSFRSALGRSNRMEQGNEHVKVPSCFPLAPSRGHRNQLLFCLSRILQESHHTPVEQPLDLCCHCVISAASAALEW